MNRARFRDLAGKFSRLHVVVAGDFCLDRYLEIDPRKNERSIETGLEVYNVVNVRAQAGAAGTVLNNLVALGVGRLSPVGFVGEDGEGLELRNALARLPGVQLQGLITTSQRRTFTYAKPLLTSPGQPPRELNRLDFKNWSPTPTAVRRQIMAALRKLAPTADAMIVLNQVDLPDTGVITREVLELIAGFRRRNPDLLVVADSRQGLKGFPPFTFKMNGVELARLCGGRNSNDPARIGKTASGLAARNGHPVFVTLAEQGIVGAAPSGEVVHVPALPVRGPIDIVGAGDSVTAAITTALRSGANLRETLAVANAAASVVIHKLGTTGTASPGEIWRCINGQK